jgi:predicted metal-binding protein
MQSVKPKWQKSGLVMVCERCYKERIPEEDPDKAAEIGDFNLRDWLKSELKESGEWGPIRVISTSCMDVCARRQVTVAIDPQTGSGHADVFVVDVPADKDQLKDEIIKRLGKARETARTD